MKILIIGGTGNISRWIVKEIQSRGYDIFIFNRGKTRSDISRDVHVLTGDRTDYSVFQAKIRDLGFFDCVIDMVGYELEDAEFAVGCFEGRVGQYIFCSTVDVFSKKQPSYPVAEGQIPDASPDFPYALKKMQMEEFFFSCYKKSGFPLTVIRPGFTYSEGWSPLLTSFGGQSYHLDRMIKNKPVIIHDDGMVQWSPLYATDLARAFAAAIGNAKAIGRSYNITGDEHMTWKAMHETVAAILDRNSQEYIYIPTRDLAALAPEESRWCTMNFQFNSLFESGQAKNDLGFKQTMSYQSGATQCLGYLQEKDCIQSSSDYVFYDRVIDSWQSVSNKTNKIDLKEFS